MKKIIRPVIAIVVSVSIVVAGWVALTRLVVPKYDGDKYPLEGNFTAEYYEESLPHDVLMVGDCEVYENFDPIYLWKNYGITSYIRGNAQQLVWHSYYMLEDALKYEKPKVVIFNVQSLTHGEPQREEYNRMALDGMRWSLTKADAVETSMCKGEKFIEYVFPLLRYHSRIYELGSTDMKYYLNRRHTTCNGYYMRIDVLPASQAEFGTTDWIKSSYPGQIDEDGQTSDEEVTEDVDDEDPWEDIDVAEDEDPWADIDVSDDDSSGAASPNLDKFSDEGVEFSEMAIGYLDRIRTLCSDNNIQLILIKAPSLAPQWYDSEEEQVQQYASKYDLPYINFYNLLKETKVDYETDTYDGGLHMNYSGAKKLSEWLGKTLTQEYGIEDHRGDTDIAKVYEEKVKAQDELIQAQQKELDKMGEIVNY